MASSESPANELADDIRPLVGRAPNSRAVWLFGSVLVVAAAGLFARLEARRSTISSPATAIPAPSASTGMIAPPPALAIPPEYPNYASQAPQYPSFLASAPRPMVPLVSAPVRTRAAAFPSPPPAQDYGPAPTAPPPPPGPAFAWRAESNGESNPLKQASEADDDAAAGVQRVTATRLVNPSTTVPQGTVIQAVLETALDSNRAGFARAVVARDVTSFDGSRVLIPKGSKLFGEYKSDLSAGQNRAMIQWRRLTRPDAGIIDLNSPSADPVGRAGVKGKVNSHFFARFGGAILQSALDIGTGMATRSISGDSYYFGVPSAMQGVMRPQVENIKPTLTVRQGTSVSVFVARDLDFTAIES